MLQFHYNFIKMKFDKNNCITAPTPVRHCFCFKNSESAFEILINVLPEVDDITLTNISLDIAD